VLDHDDAVGNQFEVEEGSAGGLPMLSTAVHHGGGESMMGSQTSGRRWQPMVRGGSRY
jgi:hypothetical protein